MTTNIPDDEELVGRLRLAVTRLARVLRQDAGSHMAPTDVAMLATIAWGNEPALSTLAATEHVAPPTVSKSINRLEADGLVERFADSSDGRVTRVRLSTAGRSSVAVYRARVNAWLEELLEELPARERDRLQGAVDLLEHLVRESSRHRPERAVGG